MKKETDFYGPIVKISDIVDITFGNGISGKVKIISIDADDTLSFEGIGKLKKSPNKSNLPTWNNEAY